VRAGDSFAFDYGRHLAAAGLRPEHYSDFQRLAKDLRYGSAFQLLIAEFNDVPYRDALIQRLDAVLADAGIRPARLVLSPDLHADFAAAEGALRALAADYGAIHIVGGETWFDAQRWEAFNIRREAVARQVPARLILWLTAEPIAALARLAPDLWAWRGGVFSFTTEVRPTQALPVAQRGPIDTRSLAERGRRIAELRTHLAAEPPLPEDLQLQLLDELASLLESLGQFDEALRVRKEEELPVYERLGDMRSKAVTQGQIANILQARGQIDEALRIHKEEELPVYERLGDVRLKAVTQGQIADILQARGQIDEALRIRKEEELPVYERLGDVRSKAITQGKMADILQGLGQLDEALRIRKEEQLLVFDRLGDVRSKAITQGKIADILRVRGQLDEALTILRDDVRPAFDRPGDVWMQARASGAIADILQARGQLDEALRIRQEEELPVYERLGDVREKAVTQGKIADILQARGQLDEALRIRNEEALPVYERLGAVREKAVTLFKIAQVHLAREAYPEAMDGLAQAYAIMGGLQEAQGLAHVGRLYGQVLCSAGEQVRGIEVLEKAAEAFTLLGQDDEAQAIQTIIRELQDGKPD